MAWDAAQKQRLFLFAIKLLLQVTAEAPVQTLLRKQNKPVKLDGSGMAGFRIAATLGGP